MKGNFIKLAAVLIACLFVSTGTTEPVNQPRESEEFLRGLEQIESYLDKLDKDGEIGEGGAFISTD